MALAKCRECGNTVSTEADACPHCGAPRPVSVPPFLPEAAHRPKAKGSRGVLRSCIFVVLLSIGTVILIGVALAYKPVVKRNVAPAATFEQKSEEARTKRRKEERQLEISNVVAALNQTNLSAEARKSGLEVLISLDPNTKEFPDEISAIREQIEMKQKLANEFLDTAKGKRISVEKWPEYGPTETLPGTDLTYWAAFLPRLEVSFVSRKDTDIVIFAGRGKSAASDYLRRERAARKERIEKSFSSWDGSHYGLTKTIKESMNDPKSYEHDKTVYADKGDYLIVETSFRGKNGFGGVVRNKCRAKCDLDGNVLEIIYSDP
jgi:hypothetical protein